MSLDEHLNMLDRDAIEQRWSAAGISGAEIDQIMAYVDELRSWLAAEAAENELQLVLTHGDFRL